MKVSYNIGADTSLLLWDRTQGVDNMDDALAAERENLIGNFGIPGDEFFLIDGSGRNITATNRAVTQFFIKMTETDVFSA